MIIFKYTKRIWNFLDKIDKISLSAIFLFSFVNIFLELLSLGLLTSILLLLLDNSLITKYPFIINLFPEIVHLNQSSLALYISICLVVVFLVKNIFLGFFQYLIHRVTYNIRFKSAVKLFDHYLNNEDYKFHLNNNSAILMRNINASRSIGIMALFIINVFTELFMILGLIFFVSYHIPSKFIIIASIVFILAFVYYLIFKRKILILSEKSQELEKKYLQIMQEGFGSIREVFLINTFSFFNKRFYKTNLKIKDVGIPLSTIPIYFKYFLEFFIVVIFLFITNLLLTDQYKGSEIMVIISILTLTILRFVPSVNKILSQYQQVNVASVPVNFALVEFEKNKVSKLLQIKLNNQINLEEKIELKNVYVKYKKDYVLEEINLKIKKNEFIGIYGESGSGKSTLVDIISGILEPNKGEIFVDNIKINQPNNIKYLNTSYISQFNYLIDDTIIKNITFQENLNKIDLEKFNKVLKLSELTSFVNSLENKFETIIGERGVNLSGGQRQRIGIARSLYNDSKILILDEPTSMLDNETENNFINSLLNFKNLKTIILISHNIENLKHCDTIYKISNKRIIKN